MTLGSPTIEKKAGLWSKTQFDGYLAIAAIGILAGIATAFTRMPMHLPGHKALFWMPAILAARLATGRRAGATVGGMIAGVTALTLGGQLAGGVLALPLVFAAGIVLDLVASAGERNSGRAWQSLLLLGWGAASANLICFSKRLFEPGGARMSNDTMRDLAYAAALHLIFGCVAGVLGTLLGWGAVGVFKKRRLKAL